jgi:hypothetical protein
MPWVIAIAMAETEGPGDVFYAVNYSPAFADPLGSFPSAAGDISTTGIESFLRQKLLGNPPDFWRRLVSGDVLHRLNRDRRSFERRDRGLLPRGNGGGDV